MLPTAVANRILSRGAPNDDLGQGRYLRGAYNKPADHARGNFIEKFQRGSDRRGGGKRTAQRVAHGVANDTYPNRDRK